MGTCRVTQRQQGTESSWEVDAMPLSAQQRSCRERARLSQGKSVPRALASEATTGCCSLLNSTARKTLSTPRHSLGTLWSQTGSSAPLPVGGQWQTMLAYLQPTGNKKSHLDCLPRRRSISRGRRASSLCPNVLLGKLVASRYFTFVLGWTAEEPYSYFFFPLLY